MEHREREILATYYRIEREAGHMADPTAQNLTDFQQIFAVHNGHGVDLYALTVGGSIYKAQRGDDGAQHWKLVIAERIAE